MAIQRGAQYFPCSLSPLAQHMAALMISRRFKGLNFNRLEQVWCRSSEGPASQSLAFWARPRKLGPHAASPSSPRLRTLNTVKTVAQRALSSRIILDGGSVGLDGGTDGKLSELDSKVGCLVEEQIAARIPELFGVPYARYLLAESVGELGQLLPHELLPGYDKKSPLYGLTVWSDALEKKLLAEGVFSQLISNIQAQGGEAVSLFKDDGEPSASAIGDYAKQFQDEVTRLKLLRLQKMASCNSDEERREEIWSPAGAGIMLLCCAALPNKYLKPGAGLPPDALEFDCRGRMQGVVANYATINIGVIQFSLDYGAAVSKLGLPLNVLRYTVAALGIPQNKVGLTGRLFFPKRSGQAIHARPDILAGAERLAMDEHGFTFYVHSV